MEHLIRQRCTRVERAIGAASQACSAERNLPGELRDCIQKLDRQSDAVQQAADGVDMERLRRVVAGLDALGERARRVCASMSTLTPQMKSAVQHVYDELAELKHDLH